MKKKKLFIAIILFITFSFASCVMVDFDNNCIHGQGEIVEQELTLNEFTKIENGSSIKVIVSQGLEQSVVAVGHANIIEKLNTVVNDKNWRINLDQGCYSFFDLTLYVTVPEISVIKVNGSGDVILEGFNQAFAPAITLTGSGNFRLNEFETATELWVSISGSGSFYAEKNVDCFEKLDVKTSGSGSFNGQSIQVDSCKAYTGGSGNCYVYVNNDLHATINGSGDIFYNGLPSISIIDNGSGSVLKMN